MDSEVEEKRMKKRGGNNMNKIAKAEIDKWANEQRRRYHAGLLEPWQVKALKKAEFDFGRPKKAVSRG